MILTVDIGNTSITCGIFDDENLVKQFRMPSDTSMTVQDYSALLNTDVNGADIDGAIIGSVVTELNNRIQYAILAQFGVMAVILSHESVMPIKLCLDNNTEIGADRIANGVRAYNLYKKAVIVVDLGTATTFDIVNSNGEFVGGLITPGIETQLNSLTTATSKLPEIGISEVKKAIGSNTKDAILSGVINGTASLIDGMLKKCEEELGEQALKIGTGGLCTLVSNYMTTKFDSINPDLTVEGLRDLYLLNKTNQPVYKFD